MDLQSTKTRTESMFDVASDYRWRLPGDDEPDSPDSPLNEILRHWLLLAAIAWTGYRQEGLGTVVVDAGDEGKSRYVSGSICTCHQDLVHEYDPECQIVVALVHDHEIGALHVVTGCPPHQRRRWSRPVSDSD